jgi:hypothetical protein
VGAAEDIGSHGVSKRQANGRMMHMAESDDKTFGSDMNLPLILTIGVVGAILVFVLIIGIEAWFYAQQQEERQAKSLMVRHPMLLDNRIQQLRNLEGYRWVDQANGVVTIPLDRAMALTIERYAAEGQEAEEQDRQE